MKFRFILNLAAATLALGAVYSCSREVEAPSEAAESGTVTEYCFTARLPQPSKTVMDDTATTTWRKGDEIAIWDTESSQYYTFTNNDGDGSEAVFTFSGTGTYNFTRAIYPASIADDYTNVTLPAAYALADATQAQTIPMIGTVNEGAISFMHLAAVLRITLEGVPSKAATLVVSSPSVSISGGFALSGNTVDDGKIHAEGEGATVGDAIDLKAGNLGAGVEIQAKDGSSAVSIDISSRENNTVAVYVPLPVGAYQFSMSLKDSESTEIWSKTTSSSREILRSALYKMNTVGAVLSGGAGTQENPYKIATAQDLVDFQALVAGDDEYKSAYYALVQDIDMSAVPSFTPVGGNAYDSRFTGVFDGAGHSIKNLSISTSTCAGLFGYLGGTVKNLDIISATVTSAGNYAAAVAAIAAYATIEHCRVDGNTTVKASGNSAGSIVGLMRAGTINACASHANISGTQAVGGIVGFINPINNDQPSLLINCSYEPEYVGGHLANATITTKNNICCMGGIVGAASHYSNLSSSGEQRTLTGSDIKIVNCYAYPLELNAHANDSGMIWHAGGIAGRIDSAVEVFNCFTPITYSNIILDGTRYDAKGALVDNKLTSAGAVLGRVYSAGCTVSRTASSKAWGRCYGSASSAETIHSMNTVKVGDPNMRGLDDFYYGETKYAEEDGGIRAALDEGAAEWNAGSPAVEALIWQYYPTFGYPKPAGIDFDGVVTKKVSIIGDSISTYDGFMFSNDNYSQSKHYPNYGKAGQYSNMIFNEQYTWWWHLIYDKMTNARLEANSAWGGTTVSYVTEQTTNMPNAPTASCKGNSLQGRYRDHGLGSPDVLFYFGGRNDYAAVGGNSHDLLGESTVEALQAAFDNPSPTLYPNYTQGTVAILKHFHDANPDAKIMLMITDLMTNDFEDGAQAIVDFLSAKGYDIRFANLHKRDTTNKENTDIGVPKEQGSHPNQVGCENIANYIWSQLGTWLDE